MLVETLAFVGGLGLGAIPSVWTYYALKKDIYLDLVMKSMLPEAGKTLGQKHVNFSKPPKDVNINDIADALIKQAKLNPDEWIIITREKPKSFDKYSASKYYFGVQNNKMNIRCLRNTLTFSQADDIYLNDIRIDAGIFNKINSGVTAAVDQGKMRKLLEEVKKPRPLVLEDMSPQAQKGLENLRELQKNTASLSKKEPVTNLIDPFAETYNDKITKMGKAKASLEHAQRLAKAA